MCWVGRVVKRAEGGCTAQGIVPGALLALLPRLLRHLAGGAAYGGKHRGVLLIHTGDLP